MGDKKESTMITGLDIYRSAAVTILRHGADAARESSVRAGRFLDAGDIEGYSTWLRIGWAIDALQKMPIVSADVLH